MPHLVQATNRTQKLERFLLSHPGAAPVTDHRRGVGLEPEQTASDVPDLPATPLLEESGLAAYAASCLPWNVGGGKLRAAYLTATARHLAVRKEMQRLLTAWHEAGIEVMLFKGFHLAEFVYPNAGGRLYSDVDLLIKQQDGLRASALAVEQGWRELWHADRPVTAHGLRGLRYRGHEILQLLNERTNIQLDAHRRLVHNNHNRVGRYAQQERITCMAWESSQSADWDGVPVRLPHPLDAVLVGLVLNRCWSPEDWQLRAHDYLDFRYLVEKYGLDQEQLQERASALGCRGTFELFLERCDPFRRRFVLSAPSQLELQRWNLLISGERGNRYLERGLMSLIDWVRLPVDIAREFPGVAATVLEVWRRGDVREVARRFDEQSSHPKSLEPERWKQVRSGVHRSLRLLGLGRAEHRDLEAVALLAALRRRSCSATLSWVPEGQGGVRPVLAIDGLPLNQSGTLLGR
ncbi:MAG: nucleotidyltransferase family protein [Trueperaceae bacterium]